MCLAFCLPLPSPMCSVSFVCFSFGFCSLLVSGCCCSSSCRRVDAGVSLSPCLLLQRGLAFALRGVPSRVVWESSAPGPLTRGSAVRGVGLSWARCVWFAAPWVTGGLVVRFRCLPPLLRGVSHGLEERYVACLPSSSVGKETKKKKSQTAAADRLCCPSARVGTKLRGWRGAESPSVSGNAHSFVPCGVGIAGRLQQVAPLPGVREDIPATSELVKNSFYCTCGFRHNNM